MDVNTLWGLCVEESKKSPCKRHKVGAALLDSVGNVHLGFNHPNDGTCSCEDEHGETKHGFVTHAEIDAKNKVPEGVLITECVVTHAPCSNCAEALIKRGLEDLFYGVEITSSAVGIKRLLNKGVNVYKKEGDKWVQVIS